MESFDDLFDPLVLRDRLVHLELELGELPQADLSTERPSQMGGGPPHPRRPDPPWLLERDITIVGERHRRLV
jgi:hypothetical protein